MVLVVMGGYFCSVWVFFLKLILYIEKHSSEHALLFKTEGQKVKTQYRILPFKQGFHMELSKCDL